ncbi:hypothetical protein EV697_10384 [Bisgaardia hudsonensis]|uniref:Sel1 repeat-containing protein n=1 Tax=Bisgaardia hudsonensis TaxID=109472 RepID=A0A4R2N093_9PAST|nr:tetratricopeptide repeat protein [Bisgaardia hudsonensis]QLB13377.1 hypothetical protein A6A11_07035 [Bisgaardia hudsonensis]TCP12780.1 hypothetical protein EV697_10384 [Bisgaardia hudsonensis]
MILKKPLFLITFLMLFTMPFNLAVAKKLTDEQIEFNTLKSLAEKGDPEAQYNLGNLYVSGRGVEQDDKQAVAWYRKSVTKGFTKAQLNLGNMYALGRGVKQNYSLAVEWYEKAAKQGDSQAQHNLGIMYEKGQGVTQDLDMAKEYFGQACDSGELLGCQNFRRLSK